MRKFDNIKPLHMESPLIREVPKYDLGTLGGGIKPITNPFSSSTSSTRTPYTVFKTKFPSITEELYNTMSDATIGSLMGASDSSAPNPVDNYTSDPVLYASANYMKLALLQYVSKMSSASSALLVLQSLDVAQQNELALLATVKPEVKNTGATEPETKTDTTTPTYDKSKVSLDTNKNVTGSYKLQKTAILDDIAALLAIINDPNATAEAKAAAQALLEKQQGALKDLKVGHVADKMNLFGNAASILNSVMPEKTEYSGPKGDITKGLDASYDAAADVASQFGPYGLMVGAGMKMIGFLNSGLNAIGGGTDGMTGIDATLGSSWGGLLTGGMSALNGFFGSTTDKFEIDNEVKADLGDAYQGAYDNLGNAADKANKKYGALSSSAFGAAQREIAEAKRKLNIMTDVRNEAKDVKAASGYEGIGLRNTMSLNGGYTSMRAAKQGMKFNEDFVKKVTKAYNGTTLLFALSYKIPKSNLTQKKIELMLIDPADPYSETLTNFKAGVDELNTTLKILAYMKSNGINIDLYDLNDFLTSDDLTTYLTSERKAKGSGAIPMRYATAAHPFFTGTHNGYSGGTYSEDGKTFIPNILNYANFSPSLYRDLAAKNGLTIDYSAITGKEGFGNYFTEDDIYDDNKFNTEILPFLMGQPTRQQLEEQEAAKLALWKAMYDQIIQEDQARILLELEQLRLAEIEQGRTAISAIINSIPGLQDDTTAFEKALVDAGITPLQAESWGYKWKYPGGDANYGKVTLDGEPIPPTQVSPHALSAKNGGILEETLTIYPKEETLYMKDGGSFNVIPEGALHKNKHHMEDAEGLTKKGIPVVTEDNGGELVLLAEIEKNEIIFRLEVTEKLEDLKKKAEETESLEEKDKYALEAGKLLAYEIMHNTDDRTGLIDEV